MNFCLEVAQALISIHAFNNTLTVPTATHPKLAKLSFFPVPSVKMDCIKYAVEENKTSIKCDIM